jgi:hypothetical protein
MDYVRDRVWVMMSFIICHFLYLPCSTSLQTWAASAIVLKELVSLMGVAGCNWGPVPAQPRFRQCHVAVTLAGFLDHPLLLWHSILCYFNLAHQWSSPLSVTLLTNLLASNSWLIFLFRCLCWPQLQICSLVAWVFSKNFFLSHIVVYGKLPHAN